MNIRPNGNYARALRRALERRLGKVASLRPPRTEGPATTARLLDGGRAAFDEIITCIREARTSIETRTFLWRDDEIGNQVAAALLDAAHRGVKVQIRKDRIAAVYEYVAGTGQSFFHKQVDPVHRFQAWFLSVVYRGGSPRPQRRNPLAEEILAHPNIAVVHSKKRFDHSKIFIFDDRTVVLGSMGIGDAHHQEWLEMAVRLDGEEHVQRLRQRLRGEAGFDPGRRIDFLTHTREASRGPRSCDMLHHRLALIESAESSLVIAMAYLGDRRYTDALIRAVRRGVDVTLVTARRSDVLGDLGRGTCDRILKKTGAPPNLAIVFLPQMVHAKVVVRDGRYADIGSANFTPLSHGVYDEINVLVDDPAFAQSVEQAISDHCAAGELADQRVDYRRLYFHIERAIVAYQGRKGG